MSSRGRTLLLNFMLTCAIPMTHNNEGKQRMEEDRKIALCLQGAERQEEKLAKIMHLPEDLRQKARAIFFAKQRGNGFSMASKHSASGTGGVGTKKGVCYSFLRGECTRGDACIFSHETGDGPKPDKASEELRKKNWEEYRANAPKKM